MPDLFSILCTTCKTKLRVRDAAVVGQILACPKCSSMVLVEAPPGWAPPLPGEAPAKTAESNGNGAAHQESAIPGKSRSATPAPLPVAKTVASPAAAPAGKPTARADQSSLKETLSDSHFADVEALFPADSGRQSATKVAAKPKTDSVNGEKRRNTPAPPPPAELPAAPAPLPKPAIDPMPGRTRRARKWALLTIGGLMGISLAISAAYFAATWSKPKEAAQAPETPSSTDPPVTPTPIDPVDPSDPGDTPPPAPEPSDPEDETPQEPPLVIEPKEPGDPLDIVNDTPRKTDDPADLKKLKEQLERLGGDVGPGDAESGPAEAASTATPPTPEAPPSRSRPEPREVDLTARLADRMLEVEFTGQPLAEVLQLLSGFSTIPITLDPDALACSKTTPAAPVHAHLKNATLEEVLAEVLKPFYLEASKLEDQIVVTRSSALKEIKCPVADLTGSDPAKVRQLTEVITSLAAPDSWKSAGGLGSLELQGTNLLVGNTAIACGEVLHVSERLRQARGGRTNTVFPPELFSLERRTARAAAKLDLPLTLNFGQPTQLVKILNRFAEETGTQIIVDWQAAGEIGWPPDADATVTVDKTPLREALSKLLAPMDLTYRVIDATTLQVTTPDALNRNPEIEAFKADGLAATPEEARVLLERITASLGGTPVLRWDAPSKTLLARLPQPQHEKLAALLDQWREKDAPESAK